MNRYVIVTPARDEEVSIRHTLQSVVAQSIRPSQWVIIDDNSTDKTAEIVREYGQQHPWIKLVEADDPGGWQRGAKVSRLFAAGLEAVDCPFEFLVKLDADVSFAPDYFENLLERFDEDPRLGIGGGALFVLSGGEWKLENTPWDHVRGATKAYRRTCYEDIGGVPSVNGWDTIDELRAQLKGWQTQSFPDLRVRHHRPTGAREGGLNGYARVGEFSYFLGYPFLVLLARSVYSAVVERPLGLAGLSILIGYLGSWMARVPRYDDRELLSYARRKLWSRLWSRVWFWKG